ncbi:hypothetical protein WSM22_40130 [Cytophagales bacterium WSM2-2]|nr:hypothetical protein WSM22_40130 [Cytophagales bacterium WSM2-2]
MTATLKKDRLTTGLRTFNNLVSVYHYTYDKFVVKIAQHQTMTQAYKTADGLLNCYSRELNEGQT